MWRALRRHRRLGQYWLVAQPCPGPLRHRGLAALTVDDGYHCFSFPSEGWDVTICEVGFRIEFSPWRVEIFCRACRGPLRCRGWISRMPFSSPMGRTQRCPQAGSDCRGTSLGQPSLPPWLCSRAGPRQPSVSRSQTDRNHHRQSPLPGLPYATTTSVHVGHQALIL